MLSHGLGRCYSSRLNRYWGAPSIGEFGRWEGLKVGCI